MSSSMEGKVVLITGAGRGIGRAEAVLFAREGACVVACDLGCEPDGTGEDPSVAASVVEEIRAGGGRAVACSHDIREPEAAEELVALGIETFGRLDAVVSNAGISRERTVLKMEDADLHALWATHVQGSFGLTRAAGRAMVDAGHGGAIVLTTAPNAFFGAARQSGMSAVAAAVVGLARSAAMELKRHGIRVNALAPTAQTRLTDIPGIRGDSMKPEHVAPVALFLASDAASEVHGEIIGVAGGRAYGFRCRETTGAFVEGGAFTVDEVAAHWDEITRT